jgi:DNA uptake protein ComE-like DNA-binding protein
MAKENKLNLNKASYEELSNNLRMVGDTRAHQIIDHRPYKSWDEFKDKVPGISDGMVDDIKKSGGYIK